MAMIDAYRIGVELVLGGDLAAGIEALVPGLERLDAGVAHANAEAAELAAGLRDVAETAPGIGQAADQLGRLSSAMAGVNQAVEAFRSHGGVPEVGIPGKAGNGAGTSVNRPAVPGIRAGSRTDVPDNVAELGASDGNGRPLMPERRPPAGLALPSDAPGVASGLTAVMPALAMGGLVGSKFSRRFDEEGSGASLAAVRKTADEVSPVGVAAPIYKVSMPSAEDAAGVYASAARILPAYVQSALAPRDSGSDAAGASAEPVWGDLASAVAPHGQNFAQGRVEAVEQVMPSLSRPGRVDTAGLVEPHPALQGPLPLMRDTVPPGVGDSSVDMSRHGRVSDPSRMRVERLGRSGPALSAIGTAISVNERAVPSGARALSRAPVATARESVPEAGAASLDAAARWLNATPTWLGDKLGGVGMALDGLSAGVMAMGASRVKEEVVSRTASEGRGTLFALTHSIAALSGAMGKAPEGWLSAARGAAAVGAGAPGAVGAGFAPALTAPYHDQGGGMSVTPHLQGYHPQGDQPGPVIHHTTTLHLDDREIARAVTRQQLRMMGGNVSGTLRPDPSIAPQYGAHLLET